jgi:hypothetical protein
MCAGTLILYCPQDAAAARRLQRFLKTFRTPKRLVGRATPIGPVPDRLETHLLPADPGDAPLATDIIAFSGDSASLVVIKARGSVGRATNDATLRLEALRQQVAHRHAETASDSREATQAIMFLGTAYAVTSNPSHAAEAKQLVEKVAGHLSTIPAAKTYGDIAAIAQLVKLFALAGETTRAQAEVDRIVASPLCFDPETQEDPCNDSEIITERLMVFLNEQAVSCRDSNQPAVALTLFRSYLQSVSTNRLKMQSRCCGRRAASGGLLF